MGYFKPKHKFNAIPCQADGIKFPSKLEKRCYLRAMRLKSNGILRNVLRQVGFDLDGGYRHFVDFCLFTETDVIFVEAKGRDLAQGKMKRQMVEQREGIQVHVVKSEDELENLVRSIYDGRE